jgi:hypothetical protein
MAILRVEGNIITYASSSPRMESGYFAPYEDTLSICVVCQQEFAAWQEDLLYRKVREVRKVKRCPPCHTPLWQCLVEQERIPWDEAERRPFDEMMRAKGYTTITIQETVWKEYLDVFSDWEYTVLDYSTPLVACNHISLSQC